MVSKLCNTKPIHFKFIPNQIFVPSKVTTDYQYYKVMQWFRVEMAPVASSITVLDTQRQLMYCIFEIDYKTVMEMHLCMSRHCVS
jgi:hypothetical protein